MSAKGYSAGTIFLQVVPVFRRVQDDIKDYVKDADRALGDQMEEVGEKAGRRAGKAAAKGISDEIKKGDYAGHFETQVKNMVRGAQREIDRLDLSTASDKMLKDLDLAKKKLRELNDTDFNLDFDAKKVIADVNSVKSAVDAITAGKHELNIDANLRKVIRDCAKIEALYDKATEDRTVKVDVDIDTPAVERKMGAFERKIKSVMEKAGGHIDGSVNREVQKLKDELDYLSRLRVGVDIGSNQLRREVAEIQADLKRLSTDSVDIDVRFEAGQAYAELAAFNTALNRADGRDIKVTAKANTRQAEGALRSLTGSGDDAANSFRSFNIVLFAVAGAGPALVPVLGAIAAGLLAIGPAAAVAGAGLGTVLVGFSGIGDALTALQGREDDMSKSTLAAARSQESAARRVADARRSAARQIEAALESQRRAQERYKDSVADVKEAEEALREARKAAQGTGRDIKDRQKDNALAIDAGLVDVFEATVSYNTTMQDGSSTNLDKEKARIALEQARRRLEELRKEQKELAKEKKKWDKEGVDGTDAVQTAQDRLNDAIKAQKDAYRDLGEAAKNVDRARADGARAVADALRAQQEAMQDVAASQQKVDDAMDNLSPAGQKFALFLFGLRSEFRAFRDEVQEVMLPGIQSAMEGFMSSRSGSVLRAFLITTAEGFSRFVQALSQSFQGPVWLEFFETLAEFGPGIQDAYGQAFISLFEALASILTTLAPYAQLFADGLANLMDRFADWAASEKGAAGLERFMDHMVEMSGPVLSFLGAFARAFTAILVALAPWGEVALEAITDFFNMISDMNPALLAALTTALVALITASQSAYAVMNLLRAGGALLASSIGIWIFAILGVVFAIAYLWKTNEGFRKFTEKAWSKISKAFSKAWKDSIKPALESLYEALEVLWNDVLKPFFAWLGPIFVSYISNYFPLLAKVWGKAVEVIAWAIKYVLVPTLRGIGIAVSWVVKNIVLPLLKSLRERFAFTWDAMKKIWRTRGKVIWDGIAKAAKWLWEKALKPAFKWIREGWGNMVDNMRTVWRRVLKPIFDFITDKALPALRRGFRKAVDAITNIWDGLRKVVAKPIHFVLDTLINDGLIAGFNKIRSWVKMDKVSGISIPSALTSAAGYATGGILPGYTPGRDVHSFVSPTAGRLELSGGEAIMRPEWTAAMGPGYVNYMNSLARRGGVNAIRQAMMGGQAFAKGGIYFPLPRARISTYPGHDGVDLNVGSGWDDDGLPFYSATDGRVTTTGYGRGYGNAVFIASPYGELVYGHSRDGSIIVHPGQQVRAGQFLARVGNTGNSSAPHLHFGFPGGSFESAMALLKGSLPVDPNAPTGGGKKRSVPGFIKDLLLHPIDTVKGWVTDKWSSATAAVKESPIFNTVKQVPLQAARSVADKALSFVPGWVKSGLGKVGDLVEGGKGLVDKGLDAIGLKNGGILPYNGTMMYDNGGYLPPGMTTVMNLTGKPEPVFTNDQWRGMQGGVGGGTIHYEPHFEGSNLRPEDVAADLNFQFRRMRRSGKYQGVG